MIQISKPVDVIIKAMGKQTVADINYKHLLYVITENVNEGMLVFNLITKELILLEQDEIRAFESCDNTNKTVNYLIENWFIVPQATDDFVLYKQIDSIYTIVTSHLNSEYLKNYIIYPTTDCNARCFYCYELGCKRINMTEQVAHDVADFIEKKCLGNPVRLEWFGGEPLYNLNAIDIICDDLNKKNITFISAMISNAYLFDIDVIEKAKSLWKLEEIQITLDGTENIYNRTKSFIYNGEISPFNKVLNNIELLLKNDITVRIRLNLGMHNYGDLEVLIHDLLEKFEKYEKLSIYVHPLFEDVLKDSDNSQEKIFIMKKIEELTDLLIKNGKLRLQYSEKYRRLNQCMADSNNSTTILPDGKLGKCEHYIDDNFYGSIYNDTVNIDYINKFKEREALGTQCNYCRFLPKCTTLKACPFRFSKCTTYDKSAHEKSLKKEIKNSYDYYSENKVRMEENSIDC